MDRSNKCSSFEPSESRETAKNAACDEKKGLSLNFNGEKGTTNGTKNGYTKLCARGHWRPAEDAKLKHLVAQYGPQNWNLIGEYLEGRSGKSCRLRWFNQLDPRINRRAFSDEEEERLLAAHRLYAKRGQTSGISSQSSDGFVSSIAEEILNSPLIVAPFTTPPAPSCSLCRSEFTGVNLVRRRRRSVRRWCSQRFGRFEIELSAVQKFEPIVVSILKSLKIIFRNFSGIFRAPEDASRATRAAAGRVAVGNRFNRFSTGSDRFDRFQPVRTGLTGLTRFDRSEPV
ncbi:putative quinone-oxidoreductase-like protein [Hibiscus syriacus]|uniref:Quinone-oxidoreductase-like protein n=1 Tax=Hibiscus syriacus TaxID=106335 RepID=A0A6A2YZ42_HIBSY|nr:putative quinone-oxidoreductase-like protein [Hibiscus syriacus]